MEQAKNNGTELQYETEIYVWSNIGHTPITGRTGAYCDVLYHETVLCSSPDDARQFCIEKLKSIQHAKRAHFEIPAWWNHNQHTGWVTL